MITFNGMRIPALQVASDFSLPPFAPLDRTTRAIPGRSGTHLTTSRQQTRVVNVPCILDYSSFQNLQRQKEELAQLLVHDEPKPLIFDIEPDRVYFALISGSFDLEEFVEHGRGTLTFLCPDPYKYALESKWTVGTYLFNNGTLRTPCVATVSFGSNATNFSLTHQQSGRQVLINWNFQPGDVLVIDMARGEIRINNLVRMAALNWRDSELFDLEVGRNDFAITSGALQMTFRERWL